MLYAGRCVPVVERLERLPCNCNTNSKFTLSCLSVSVSFSSFQYMIIGRFVAYQARPCI